ncbi:MAG: hypothetical protein GY936_11795 [Ignavibacteriae bacterium]|nr:hypothetical protein [Ignavibacteriota bacterium]
MKIIKTNGLDRRRFFNKISLGAVGAILLSAFPFKLLAGSKKNIKKVSVKIHPKSVKRNS